MLPEIIFIYLISILRHIYHHDVDGFIKKMVRKNVMIVNSLIGEYLKQPSLNVNHDEKELDIGEICKNIEVINNTFK